MIYIDLNLINLAMRGSSVGLRPWDLTQWLPIRVPSRPLEVLLNR